MIITNRLDEKANKIFITKSKLLKIFILLLFFFNLGIILKINNALFILFSTLFILFVPGYSLIYIIRLKSFEFLTNLIYSLSLSISTLMFGGLFANWVFPIFGIVKPLSTIPLLVFLDIFLILIWGIENIKRGNNDVIINIPKYNKTNKIFFVIPIIILIFSIIGSVILNNQSTNYLTFSMLGIMAAYVVCVVFFRNKLNNDIYPWSILMMSMSLLLMVSLRSWHISGWDIHQELYVYKLTSNNHLWSISAFRDAYNACLSITILPTVITIFTSINNEYVYKFLYPLIFSFIPLCLFILIKKSSDYPISFLSCFLFIIQPTYFIGFTMVLRQGIAFIFFILLIQILFSEQMELRYKNLLFYIFSISMVVSHYSTAFVSIGLFLFIFSFIIISKIITRKNSNNNTFYTLLTRISEDSIVSLKMISILLLFTFFWYSMLTKTAGNIISYTNNTFINFGTIIKNEFTTNEPALLKQFDIFYKLDTKKSFEEYTTGISVYYNKNFNINLYPESAQNYSKPTILLSRAIPSKINDRFSFYIYNIIEVIKKIIKIFTVVGIYYYLFYESKKNYFNRNYLLFMSASTVCLIFGIIVPSVSVDYDLLRLFQQTLIFLSLPTIVGGYLLSSKFFRSHSYIFMTIILVILFIFYTGFLQQIVGGSSASMQLNNFGDMYDRFYIYNGEVASATWLGKHAQLKDNVFADKMASWLLMSYSMITRTYDDVLPSTINKNSYVFLRSSNVINHLNFKRYEGHVLSFSFPNSFLNENKDLIYSNNKSQIYK